MRIFMMGVCVYAIVLSLFVTDRVNKLSAEISDSDLLDDKASIAVVLPEYTASYSNARFASISACNARIAACN